MDKKRRFAYLVILGLLVYYDCYNRTINWIVNKKFRVIRKYEIRWMHKYNPESRVMETAVENLQLPKNITQKNYYKLAKVFLEVENQMLYGVSRQLIINVLNKMERMDSKMALKFLSDSGYTTTRGRALHSCDLLELCTLFETVLDKVKNDKSDQENQDELVNKFIDILPKEVQNFEDTIESVIASTTKKP